MNLISIEEQPSPAARTQNSSPLHTGCGPAGDRLSWAKSLRTGVVTLGFLLLPLLASAETYRFDTQTLDVINLIGEIKIVGHDGDDFIVEANIQGEDADRVEVEIDKGRSSVLIVRPLPRPSAKSWTDHAPRSHPEPKANANCLDTLWANPGRRNR